MVAVRGSKQHQMVVVPHRPFYKVGIFCVCLLAMAALSWLTYEYGLDQGIATRVEVVKEREALREQLQASASLVKEMRQEIATLKLGEEVDTRANEEVLATIEGLQTQIAELQEEIRFYKGVMLPNAESKGLRIERFDLKPLAEANTYSFGLLLTQVVDKHDYVQGGVELKVIGRQGAEPASLDLATLTDGSQQTVRFRFRYFQNIDGQLTIPAEFQPEEIMVIAQSSGNKSQRLERRFDWQVGGD